MKKRIIDLARVRRVPAQFSWVDHRLIRRRLLSGCALEAWALYLMLVTVGDAEGISYYSDGALCGHLKIEPGRLDRARRELIGAGLIAWEAPYYQVLDLGKCRRADEELSPEMREGETASLASIFGELLKKGSR
jgi:hypothetical protein